MMDLTKNVLIYTLSFLDLSSLFNFSLTCKKGSLLFKEESLWRLLFLRDKGEGGGEKSWMEKYKNSLLKWEERSEGKYSLSKDKKSILYQDNRTLLIKTVQPLSLGKIHKSKSSPKIFYGY